MNLREEQKLFKETQKIARPFMRYAGVTDIELGLKHTDGKLTNELALRFKVTEKRSEKKLKKSEVLPKQVGKLKTDVLLDHVVQHARSTDPRSKVRPLMGGIQIQSGLYTSTAYWGTMGCLYAIENYIFGFTNYHVLYGGAGPSIVLNDYVGRLPIFQNLNRANNQIGVASNLFHPDLDFATFVIQVPHDPVHAINGLTGVLESYTYPYISMPVFKSGACTGITYGIIDGRSCLQRAELSIYQDERYPNPTGVVSDSGDSGAVWVFNDSSTMLKPVALHHGGGETPQWAKAKTFAAIFASVRNQLQHKMIV